MADLVPLPPRGRRFSTQRRVRFGDADADGRLRLDAAARYLQDISTDDTRDVGHDPTAAWVVRRTTIEILEPMTVGETVDLTTFCSGIGGRWADRRTSLAGSRGGHLEAESLWVFLDPVSGRPARLGQAFLDAYVEAAGGRTASARLRHGSPPAGGRRRSWPLRSTDFDMLGHVNNAATWEAVVDELARRDLVPVTAELEYHHAIDPSEVVDITTSTLDNGRIGIWLTVDSTVRASAEIEARPRPT